MSTEKIVCLLKNAGGLQLRAAAAVGFYHLHQQYLAPVTDAWDQFCVRGPSEPQALVPPFPSHSRDGVWAGA